MTKDYVKYTKFQYTKRNNSRNLWVMVGIAVVFLILGGLFLKPAHKQAIMQQTEDKLKKEIVEVPAPKPPEPKFDFYNILPQNRLSLSPSLLPSSADRSLSINEGTISTSSSSAEKSLDIPLSVMPEQIAIKEETKKKLEQEVGRQLTSGTYILELGDFAQASQAEQLQAQALLKGFPVESKINLINGKPRYHLFMGPYLTISMAIQQQASLEAGGIKSSLIENK